ncbi:hypothetical protein V6N13_131167 [Hibiscus sabdariffa]
MVVSTATRQSPGADFRDSYGFAVRPHHVQRYLEYANIYKEEEEERSGRWNDFLERQAESAGLPIKEKPLEEGKEVSPIEVAEDVVSESQKGDGDKLHDKKFGSDCLCDNDDTEKEYVLYTPKKRDHWTEIWIEIRPSLRAIEDMMSARVKKKRSLSEEEQEISQAKPLSPAEDARFTKGASEEDSEDEFYDAYPDDDVPTIDSTDTIRGAAANAAPTESLHPWKEELEVLVRGGVPMALRGEIWQAFVGVRTRRVENYYQDLLAYETKIANNTDQKSYQSDSKGSTKSLCGHEKWKGQIEKDLPRTFPGHPSLDGDGRNALRRLLTAYALHNPSVGYCQAMNFFAALLLLLMPEENAFWTLMGIIDEYFDGYFSEEMIESQVDQLVFEEMSSRSPGSSSGMGYWTVVPFHFYEHASMGKWSVLRIWDVFLFEGNRVMLFRTALALIEFYAPALLTTKDAGDAVTLLQSLASSTFDSSQLVLTACMGYQNVNEQALCELREKHRSVVKAAVDERVRGLQIWRKSQESESMNAVEVLSSSTGDAKLDPVPKLQQQVVGLKAQLYRLLEEKKTAVLRSEALETALMEMVKLDNRRQLSAKVERLEREVRELCKALSVKLEQENAMLQVLMRMEQYQKETEDARMFAEQDAAGQRYSVEVLQVKYTDAITKLAEMEKRAVLAESMLEATLQYQKSKPQLSLPPRSSKPDSLLCKNKELQQEKPSSNINLLARPFVLNWRDSIKGKMSNDYLKSSSGDQNTEARKKDTKASENNSTDTNDEKASDTEVQGISGIMSKFVRSYSADDLKFQNSSLWKHLRNKLGTGENWKSENT